MSVCHWVCEGIGVRDDDVYPYLNFSKCFAEIQKIAPNDYTLEEFDADALADLTCGNEFQCIGEFLARLDDHGVLSFGDNNDGQSYCYYAPTYPWFVTDNDPKSLQEAREYVKDVVRKVCDIDEDVLDRIIDNDIYEYGCG